MKTKRDSNQNKRAFSTYYAKLAREGLLKALICALCVGLAFSAVIAFVFMLNNSFNMGRWVSVLVPLAAGLVVATGLTPLIYIMFFKPNTSDIAYRVDRLGLEERLVTMLELQNDDSYIAMRQREDAQRKLRQVSPKRLKMSMFVAPLVALAIVFACSATMMTVSAIQFDDKIQWEAITRPEEPKGEVPLPDQEYVYYYIEYIATPGAGYIDGEAFQVVVAGSNGSKVIATAYEGFSFAYWVATGSKEKIRMEENVQSNISDYAHFTPSGDGEGDGEGEEPNPEVPVPEDGDGQFDPNAIIDGGSYLSDPDVPDYVAKALQKIAAGEDIPESLRRYLQAYFDAIKVAKTDEPAN